MSEAAVHRFALRCINSSGLVGGRDILPRSQRCTRTSINDDAKYLQLRVDDVVARVLEVEEDLATEQSAPSVATKAWCRGMSYALAAYSTDRQSSLRHTYAE